MKAKLCVFLLLSLALVFNANAQGSEHSTAQLKRLSLQSQALYEKLLEQTSNSEQRLIKSQWRAAKQKEASLYKQLVNSKAQQDYLAIIAPQSIEVTGLAECKRIESEKECLLKAEKIALTEAAKEGGHYFIEASSKSLNERIAIDGNVETSSDFSEQISMKVKAQIVGFNRVSQKVEKNKFTSIRQASVTIMANVAGQHNPNLQKSLLLQAQEFYKPYLSSSDIASLADSKEVSIGDIKLAFVHVPSGQFIFGSNSGNRNESPVKSEQVSAFYLSNIEITQELYNLCIKALACSKVAYKNAQLEPAFNLNWYEIVDEFIPWLSVETGLEYRLPTEIEWEFAAKKGRGSVALCHVANGYFTNSTCDDGINGVAQVGSLEADKLGLYDMLGNVAEWTYSCWQNDHKSNSRRDCNQATVKGGSWYNKAYYLRPSARLGKAKHTKLDTLGFRLVLVN